MNSIFIRLMAPQVHESNNSAWATLVLLLIIILVLTILYIYSSLSNSRKKKNIFSGKINNDRIIRDISLVDNTGNPTKKSYRRRTKKILPVELKHAIHHSENSRYLLALFVCIPVFLIGLYLTFTNLIIIPIYVVAIYLIIWITLSILKAKLKANAVKVNEYNFPEILKIYKEVQDLLNYHKNIPIYIYEESTVNALLLKFFRIRFIVLHSELVSGMLSEKNILQLKWVIARFIGSLKVKDIRLEFLRILIETIEEIKLFNFFILPYERATVYTGDNLGLLVCQDVKEVMLAFNKFVVGNKLASKIHFTGWLDQSKDTNDHFFTFLARLGSRHPHMIDRHLNLLAFSKRHLPESYQRYLSQFVENTSTDIENRLHNDY